MKIGGATYCKNDIETELKTIKKIGFDFAELDLGMPVEPNEDFKNNIQKYKNIIPILVGHLPETDFKRDEIEKCKHFIDILSEIDCHIFIIHLFSRNLTTKDNLRVKIDGLKELSVYAKNKNSFLVLENTEEDVDTFKEVFNKIPEMFFCLDIGHANLFTKENRSLYFIDSFGKILKHVHIHDNMGGYSESSDVHLPLGNGKINFEPIIKKLNHISYSGNLTMEIISKNEDDKKSSILFIKKLLNSI